MYTIAIAAVDKFGSRTFYSEPCTSILAATFSGNNVTPNIVGINLSQIVSENMLNIVCNNTLYIASDKNAYHC